MEFGSDYHIVDNLPQLVGVGTERWRSGNFYANGRQAINDLIAFRGWNRIWIPRYFCYEIVDSIARCGIEIAFYEDSPMADDSVAISQIRFTRGDVLLRMNYFGLRGWRDSASLGVEVIEDHSHDLTGDWVDNSNAAWCIASVRKSLPVGEGGVLWSPQGLQLPEKPMQTEQNIALAAKRMEAMKLKTDYLKGDDIDKDSFRKLYVETESYFENLPLSAMAQEDYEVVDSTDVAAWNALKKSNWVVLNELLRDKIEVLQPENDRCNPLSFVIRGQQIRQKLIDGAIYSAILWPVEEDINQNLLSIHCDGRYSVSDIKMMAQKIEKCLK